LTTSPDKRRIKKRHLAALGGAALTALTFIEGAAPMCPVLEQLGHHEAAAMCRAITLTAGAARHASEGQGEATPASSSSDTAPGGEHAK
jgi:hypothetical protein